MEYSADFSEHSQPAHAIFAATDIFEQESLSTNSHTEIDTYINETIPEYSETNTEVNDLLNKKILDKKEALVKTLDTIPQYNSNAELILNSIYQETDVAVPLSAIQLLTEGFVTQFMPSLMKAQSSINQIKLSQSVLLETVQQETYKFTDCQAILDLKETMLKAKQNHNKLLKMRKEMTDLHEKSKKLKKRALKLQQQKQKEELTRAHNLEKEFEKEKMLTARVATPHD